MQFQHFNPNVEISGDCAIRACVVASEQSYEVVEKALNGLKDVRVIDVYKKFGGKTLGFMPMNTQLILQICEENPQFNYILFVKKHCAGIRENVLMDTFDIREDRASKTCKYLTIFKANDFEVERIRRRIEEVYHDDIIARFEKGEFL